MNLMNKVLDTIQELYHNKDIVYVTLSNWLKNHFIGGVIMNDEIKGMLSFILFSIFIMILGYVIFTI